MSSVSACWLSEIFLCRNSKINRRGIGRDAAAEGVKTPLIGLRKPGPEGFDFTKAIGCT